MSHDRLYHRLAVSMAKELTLGYLRTSFQNFITLQTLIFETKIREFADFLSMRPQNSVWEVGRQQTDLFVSSIFCYLASDEPVPSSNFRYDY